MSSSSPDIDLGLTIGTVLVGDTLSCMLYGCTCFQVYLYFSRFSSPDARALKAMVFLVWVLETVHMCFGIVYVYDKLIINFGQTHAILITLPKEDTILGISACVILLTQLIYAVNIHSISDENWLMTGLVVIVSVAHFGLEIAVMTEKIRIDEILAFHKSATPLSIATATMSAFTDLFLTAILCYYLRARSIGLTPATNLLNKLTLYIISSGFLTGLLEIVVLATFIGSPTTSVYFAVILIVNNLYSNAILALLNSRESLMLMPRTELVKPLSGMNFALSTFNSQRHQELRPSTPSKKVEIFTDVNVEEANDRWIGASKGYRQERGRRGDVVLLA